MLEEQTTPSVLNELAFSPAFEDFKNTTVAVGFFNFQVKKVGTETKGSEESTNRGLVHCWRRRMASEFIQG